jgi:hypothetical protein
VSVVDLRKVGPLTITVSAHHIAAGQSREGVTHYMVNDGHYFETSRGFALSDPSLARNGWRT